jgi:hypothetical protein
VNLFFFWNDELVIMIDRYEQRLDESLNV